jgi:hypothetical protein
MGVDRAVGGQPAVPLIEPAGSVVSSSLGSGSTQEGAPLVGALAGSGAASDARGAPVSGGARGSTQEGAPLVGALAGSRGARAVAGSVGVEKAVGDQPEVPLVEPLLPLPVQQPP